MDVGYKVISQYERSIIKGSRKSKADALIEKKIVRETLKNMLSSEVDYELPDGTSVLATPLDLILSSAINDAIKNGSFEKVKTIASILGEDFETKEKTLNVNLSLVDRGLIGKDVDSF